MTSFVYSLHADASPTLEAIVKAGLEARFPAIGFIHGATPIDGFENVILPISGYPHPTDPDAIVMRPPPADLVDDVRETFGDLVRQASAFRPS